MSVQRDAMTDLPPARKALDDLYAGMCTCQGCRSHYGCWYPRGVTGQAPEPENSPPLLPDEDSNEGECSAQPEDVA